MLINGGVFGAFSYLGIFVTAFQKFGTQAEHDSLYVLGAMVLMGYVANDFFSFQQVVTTPIVFVVLGMLENRWATEGQGGKNTLPLFYKKRLTK